MLRISKTKVFLQAIGPFRHFEVIRRQIMGNDRKF